MVEVQLPGQRGGLRLQRGCATEVRPDLRDQLRRPAGLPDVRERSGQIDLRMQQARIAGGQRRPHVGEGLLVLRDPLIDAAQAVERVGKIVTCQEGRVGPALPCPALRSMSSGY